MRVSLLKWLGAALLAIGAGATLAHFAGVLTPTAPDEILQDTFISAAAAGTEVFINEFHYDNAGTDTGEFIEIAGPAGTDLSGWSIVLYNGSNGTVYDTDVLTGTLTDNTGTGFGFATASISGLQNGSPDGIALVDNSGNLVQFLGYEGTFTGVGGAADGIEAVDIGVSESGSTPAGFSLQLGGTGCFYEDFAWNAPADDTPGAVNNSQTFDCNDDEPIEPLVCPTGYELVALEDFDGGAVNLVSGFNPATDNLDGGGGDFFGVGSQTAWPQSSGIPFSIGDDSVFAYSGSIFAGDTEGIFGQNSDLDNAYFAMSDTREWGTPSATWVFTVSGYENLQLLVGMGGISNSDFGGFNTATDVVFVVDVDGNVQTAFDLDAVSANGFSTRPMDSGNASGGGRVLVVNGDGTITKYLAEDNSTASNTYLDKTPASGAGAGLLDVFATNISDTGSTLTLTMTADFPFEAMAFDNITICGEPVALAQPWINEFHYDNTGSDTGEFIEIAGPAGTDLSSWTIVPYNGSNGSTYSITSLSGTLGNDTGTGFGFATASISGLQNGSPDGFALVDPDGNVVQFLSYEGTFTAASGPAAGMTSVDVGVSEPGSTPVGESLQLAGTGCTYDEFTWQPPANDTPGAANNSQIFDCNPTPSIALSIDPTSISENGGSATGTVTRTGDTSAALTVNLSSSDTGEATVPASVEIAANETETTFTVTGVDETDVDGTQIVTITAAAAGFDDATATVDVEDDDAAIVYTKIHDIQGSGTSSPLDGQVVTIEGIVVGDFQDGDTDTNRNLRGFFVQEETADFDADGMTSEGIFIFEGGDAIVDVNVGDLVQVTGTVDEYFGETQLDTVTNITVVSTGNIALTAPAVLDLPFASVTTNSDGEVIANLEAYEGMWVNFPETLTVTELFNLDRFGELRASENGRLEQFTQNNAPSVAGYAAHLEDVAKRNIMIDDGQSIQNPNPVVLPGLGDTLDFANDSFRMGDTITNLYGIVRFSRGSGGSGDETYRILPYDAQYSRENIRPATPDAVGGSLTVASFNVLNFFTTLDEGSNLCGPTNQDCRGADSQAEYQRQLDKLVTALVAMDADIVGLIELENNPAASPANDGVDPVLEALVAELNARSGRTYGFVDAGVIGTDAIKVAFIYDVNTVNLVGNAAILDSSVDPNFIDTKNRPALAQTFEEAATGGVFTVVVNHLKSKGSACDDVGDPDLGDGQGNCNGVRTAAAQALADWLATDPTGSGDEDFLIMGDLNSYAMEAPITTLEAAGYTDLAAAFITNPYGYVFDGQLGTLDYALANASLLAQVTGVTEWHINADEPDLIDYNLDFGTALRQAVFRDDLPFRASDHDPVVIGLNLEASVEPVVINVTQSSDTITEGEPIIYTIESDIPSNEQVTLEITLEGTGTNPIDGNDLVGNAVFPGSIQMPFTTGSTMQVTVTPDDDFIYETDEEMTFSIRIVSGDNHISVGTASAVTTVLDNEDDIDYVVESGSANASEWVIGSRSRSFASDGDREMFLGLPDLGRGGATRSERDIVWAEGENEVTFELDRANDKLVMTVVNTNGTYTLEYTNLAANIAADGKTYTLDDLDIMQITLSDRDDPAEVSFTDVTFNGYPLGDFDGEGFLDFTVKGFDFSKSFIMSGTINLSGEFSGSAELSRVEILVGVEEVVTPVTINVTQSADSINEGEPVTYTIESDIPSNEQVTLEITLEGTGTNPIDGDDLASNAVFPGSIELTYTTGDSLQFTVTPDDDSDVEPDEEMTFSIRIINGDDHISVGTDTAATAVLNNDQALGRFIVGLYEDRDGDGRKDHGDDPDPGLEDWVVTLYDLEGNELSSRESGKNGYVNFFDVTPGEYTICVTPLEDWINLTPGDNCQNGVAVGGENTSVSFGYYRYGHITVEIYEDLNGDGRRNFGDNPEPVLLNQTATLYDADGNELSTVGAGPNGYINFWELFPGEYTVCVPTPVNYTNTDPGSDPACKPVTVPSGADELVKFGHQPIMGTITIVKDAQPDADWLDWEFAISQDDQAIANFWLDNDASNDDQLDRETFSLYAGTYSISELNAPGNWDTDIYCGDEMLVANANGTERSVEVTIAGGEDLTCTFVNKRRGQVQITKLLDADGMLDTSTDQVPGAGWQMFLYQEVDGDYIQIQPREVRTNVDGIANYTSLTPDTYAVCEDVQDGYTNLGALVEGNNANTFMLDGRTCVEFVSNYTEIDHVTFINTEDIPENLPPTVNPIADQHDFIGESASIQVTANDPEGLQLYYNAIGLPTGISIDFETGLISGTFTEAGIFNVTVTVIDSEGQTAITEFTWIVEEPTPTEPTPTEPTPTEPTPTEPTPTEPTPTEPTPTEPTPTEPTPTEPTPTQPVPEVQELELCWIENPNGNTSAWQVTNPNPVPLYPGQPDKVVFSWQVFDAEGNILQSAERWDQTGETRINTVLASHIEVTWYVFDNELSEPIGMAVAFATVDYLCETEAVIVPVTPSPSPTEPTPTEPTPTEPTPTEPAPTPVPQVEVQTLEVCWIENPNGNTSAWQVNNPNPVPLIAGQPDKVMFSWQVFDAEGNVLQSAERWDQTGFTRINTVLASHIQVTWYYFDNSLSDPMGTTMAFSVEEDRCGQ